MLEANYENVISLRVAWVVRDPGSKAKTKTNQIKPKQGIPFLTSDRLSKNSVNLGCNNFFSFKFRELRDDQDLETRIFQGLEYF